MKARSGILSHPWKEIADFGWLNADWGKIRQQAGRRVIFLPTALCLLLPITDSQSEISNACDLRA
jgi:hypothetical protein